jgi:hypothetical protein
LNGPLSLLLHDGGASGDMLAMRHVSNPKSDKVACSQLAVDGQVEQGEVAHPVGDLQPHAHGLDLLELQGRFLSDELAFVPGLVTMDLQSQTVS